VVNAGVEVGVVTDSDGQEELRLAHRDEMLREALRFSGIGERKRKRSSQLAPGARAGSSELVEIRPGIDPQRREVEYLVADRHAASRLFRGPFPFEYAKGQVLDREVARRVPGGIDPALQIRIVRSV
jgi:hypothetical protein